MLLGYFAIHLLGLSTGTLVLAPSPSYFRRRQQQLAQQKANGNIPVRRRPSASDSDTDDDVPTAPSSSEPSSHVELRRENDKTATELCSYAVLWWVLLGALKLFGVGGDVSRRMANLPYIIWIAAYNSTFLLGYLVLDLVFFPSPLSKSVYSPTSKLKVHPDPDLLKATRHLGTGAGREREDAAAAAVRGSAPALLEAVNKNGLVLFLLVRVRRGFLCSPLMLMFVFATTEGERGDRIRQPVDADDVHVGLGCDARLVGI